MTPQDFLTEAESRLAGAKFATERLDLRGLPAVAGRKKPFRAQWMFTQLKTTVLVCAADTVTLPGWHAFLNDAFQVARAIKGGLPTGIQGAIGCVPILVADAVDPAAAVAAANEKAKIEWFQGMSMPALVDLPNRAVYAFEGAQFTGAVFIRYLRKQRDLVTSIVHTQ